MTIPQVFGWKPDPADRCAWCNTILSRGEGNQQGKDHICDDCLDEIHHDCAWDRADR